MEKHHKALLAGELLVEAAKTYRAGDTNVDFAKSILLAGAVIGIIAPWLEELGGKSSQTQWAELAIKLKGIALTDLPLEEQDKEKGKAMAFYRLAYNSLKHAGKGEKIKPSSDLYFEANLKEEAYCLISCAIND